MLLLFLVLIVFFWFDKMVLFLLLVFFLFYVSVHFVDFTVFMIGVAPVDEASQYFHIFILGTLDAIS